MLLNEAEKVNEDTYPYFNCVSVRYLVNLNKKGVVCTRIGTRSNWKDRF